MTKRSDYAITDDSYTYQLYYVSVDGVIAICNTICELLTAAGVDPKKIRLIHSGVDAHRFESIPLRPNFDSALPVVGSLAVMEERKGHRYLLEAARLLKQRGQRIRYLLGGDGSLKNELEKIVARLGLNEDVSFPGF